MATWPFKSYFDTLEEEQKKRRTMRTGEDNSIEQRRKKMKRHKKEAQLLHARMGTMKQIAAKSTPINTDWWPMKKFFDDKKKNCHHHHPETPTNMHKSLPLPRQQSNEELRSAQYIYNSV